MPFCPSCFGEFVTAVQRCPNCGATLVADLPRDPLHDRRVRLGEAVVQRQVAFVAQGSLDAAGEMADELLAAGVAAQVTRPVADCEHEGGQPCNHFAVAILPDDEAAAVSALRGRHAAMLAREGVAPPAATPAGDACPACGTSVSADAGECPDCGLVFG